MADRTVTYVFRGNFTNLAAGLTAAGRGVTDLGVKMTALDKNGAKMRAGLTAFGSTAGKVGLVAAAGFGVIVAAAANFEQAMSNVQAATHETSGNMELLRKAAIDAGQATKYSASEAAGAIEELAKAGVSTKDILAGGLSGALDLAAAGGLEVADAAQIAATALTQFKLEGKDVPHVADLLAAGAGKAQGDVSDLSMALKQSGLVASQMGVSIEETTGTLSAFASAGLLGSDAGTSFRTMLLRLANPTQESAALMEQLGIQAYNAQGQFVGIESLAGQLATAFQGQTQAQRDAALATLFGSDAIRAANVLYNQGAQGIADWTAKVNDQGYAAETAATKMDNLSGDLEQLKGSLETALIGAGTGSQGPLRQLVQSLTDVVNAFNKLPQPAKNATTALFGVTAVLGGGLWFTSKTVQGIANTRKALSDLGITAGTTGNTLGRVAGMAGRIVGLAGAVSILGNALAEATGAKVNVNDLQRNLEALANGSSTELVKRLADDYDRLGYFANKATEPIYETTTLFGILGNTPMDNASDNISQVDEALASMVESGNAESAAAAFQKIAAAITGMPEQSSFDPSVIDGFDSYATALRNAASSAEGAAGAAGKAAGATDDYGVSARQSAEASKQEAAALKAAIDAMQKKTSATLAAFDAETGYRQALKDAKAQADKNNAGIKGNTDAALANRSALSQLAGAWNNQSAAVKNNVERYRDARRSFIQTAEAMGVPTAAAKRLADQILEIPKSKVSKVGVDGADEATRKVQTLNRELSRVVSKTITITVNRVGAALGGMQFASGGYTGPGGVHEPAGIVHRGEVVIPQRYVKRDWSMLRARYGDLPGFASGGVVGPYATSRTAGTPAFALVDPTNAAASSLYNLAGAGKKELEARKKLLDKEIERDQKAVDLAKQHADAIREDIKSLRESVANRFKSDLFAQQQMSVSLNTPQTFESAAAEQAWAQAQQFINNTGQQSPVDILRQDIADARRARELFRRLRKAGLHGAALTYAQQNASNEQLAALLGDPQMLRQYQRLYGTRERVAGAAGNTAAMQRWGKAQERAVDELVAAKAELKASNAELKQVNKRLHHLEQLAQKAPKETGDHVGDKVNGASSAGARGRVATW